MSLRRSLLLTACGLLTALAARRVHALSDPSELSVGGSAGAHDAHITCGPDVRVRHASGGVHYERVFEDRPGSDRGMSLDVRAGVGSTTIASVADEGTNADATALANNERDRAHVLGTGQVLAGWDWRTFALRGGLGYFGFSDVTDDKRSFATKYYPLPALDMRIGRRSGFRGNLGVGAPPIVGLTRWYSLYGLATYRFKEGGEVGTGLIASFGGELDRRAGWVFQGSVPITDWMHVGGFGVVGADDDPKVSGFNWTAGAGVRFLLDSAD